MARPADIEDPSFRAALEEAERLLDAGEFTKAARKCAETYLQLLDKRPDLVPPPGMGFGGFGFGFGPPAGPSPAGPAGGASGFAAGYGNVRAVRRAAWPSQGGIRLVVDEDRRPSLVYEKDRFSFSEAATYFEFLLEQLVQAQREPAP